jgi:hypothetical protein
MAAKDGQGSGKNDVTRIIPNKSGGSEYSEQPNKTGRFEPVRDTLPPPVPVKDKK